MTKGDIETYYEDGSWKNEVPGSSRAANAHDTKAEAEAKGRHRESVPTLIHWIGRLQDLFENMPRPYDRTSVHPRGHLENEVVRGIADHQVHG